MTQTIVDVPVDGAFFTDSITIYPGLDFELVSDKKTYNRGKDIQLEFKFRYVVFDADLSFPLIFQNQERLAVSIFKEKELIYKSPKVLTPEPDTLLVFSNTQYFATHTWYQVDDDNGQISSGKYLIKVHLIHDIYNKNSELEIEITE